METCEKCDFTYTPLTGTLRCPRCRGLAVKTKTAADQDSTNIVSAILSANSIVTSHDSGGEIGGHYSGGGGDFGGGGASGDYGGDSGGGSDSGGSSGDW
jgi:hypothetical protein